jgi:ElaB/YqjD/DUF883 family membrane-anchored ribosome-binding protein
MKTSNETKADMDKSTEQLKDAARAAADGFRHAAEGLRGAAHAASDELAEAGAAAARGAHDLWDQAGNAIRKNPMAAFGIAFAAGILLAKLMRR